MTGFPGPGGSTRSAPMTGRHHSVGTSGSVASVAARVFTSRRSGWRPAHDAGAAEAREACGGDTPQAELADELGPSDLLRQPVAVATLQLDEVGSRGGRAHEKHRRSDQEPPGQGSQRTRQVRSRRWRASSSGSAPISATARGRCGRRVGRLRSLPETRVVRVSTLRNTEPVGYVDQPRFLNGAVELETELRPACLLDALLEPRTRFRARPQRRAGARAAYARSRPPAVRGRGDRRARAEGSAPPAARAALRARAPGRARPGPRSPWKRLGPDSAREARLIRRVGCGPSAARGRGRRAPRASGAAAASELAVQRHRRLHLGLQ